MVESVRPAVVQKSLFDRVASEEGPCSFVVDGGHEVIARLVRGAAGGWHRTELPLVPAAFDASDLRASFDAAWLRRTARPWGPGGRRTLRSADVFSGCGGLTLGVCDAAWALGLGHETVLAIDLNATALRVFEENFRPRLACCCPVESLFDGEVGRGLTAAERRLRSRAGKVDLLVGGPPCQGHSDLNNHTRRRDDRNDLYARMARCAEVLEADHVVIENVPGVVHDKGNVIGRTAARLLEMGYLVAERVLDATAVGVPQMRKRHFLVASRQVRLDLREMQETYRCPPRPLGWAIGDLLDAEGGSTFDTRAKHHAANVARIDYLFDHDLYDLPDARRPDCHRLKDHAYKAVYGRMRWDQPAPTITRGFGSTGQGRFVHPRRRGTLTPHEAARVQFFPDFVRFADLGRRALQELIGNAVPSKLASSVVLELLRSCRYG
ncbi:MAG TPA: DNA cytosine methyltransferase [Gemmataceae bacterium]|nr:DNA cytosine methyltransferase [Gemmataceae bacterium]